MNDAPAGILQVIVTAKFPVFVISGKGQIPGEFTDTIWSVREGEKQMVELRTVIVKEQYEAYGIF